MFPLFDVRLVFESVPRCYEMEIGPLNVSESRGVPMEHLISCIKGVGIASVAGHKRLQWAGKSDQVPEIGNGNFFFFFFLQDVVVLVGVAQFGLAVVF